MATLFCDKRETSVIPYLVGKTGVALETLHTSDYAIKVNGVLKAVFERKSLDDFGQSISDLRTANKQNLIEARNKTGCLIYYIIEGPAWPADDKKFGGIKYSAIKASIARLQTQHAINILRTKDPMGTAAELLLLLKSFLASTVFDEKVAKMMPTGQLVFAEDEVVVQNIDGKVIIECPPVITGSKELVEETLTIDQLFETENLNPDDVLKMRAEQTAEQKRVGIWMSITGIGRITATKLAQRPIADYLTTPKLAEEIMTSTQLKAFLLLFDKTWNEQQTAFIKSLQGVGPKKAGEFLAHCANFCEVTHKHEWIARQLI